MRKKRQYKKSSKRREEIIEAAEVEFGERGFLKTTIDDIIGRVGISHSTLYHHFPTKKSILLGLATSRAEKVRKHIREWTASESLTPRERIELVLKDFESTRKVRIAIERVGIGVVRQDAELHDAVMDAILATMSEDLGALIQQGVEAGDFRVHHPQSAAVMIIFMCMETIHRIKPVGDIADWADVSVTLRQSVLRLLGVAEA